MNPLTTSRKGHLLAASRAVQEAYIALEEAVENLDAVDNHEVDTDALHRLSTTTLPALRADIEEHLR